MTHTAPAPDGGLWTPFAEITVFTKRGGALSKHIELVDGRVANDSSDCAMAEGMAQRIRIDLGACLLNPRRDGI